MKTRERPLILVLCDYYLPGYKSGGGMRTIVNMVDRLRHKYDFRIITRDHDGKLDSQRYDSVEVNEWNHVQGAEVYYLSKDNIKLSKLRNLINEVNPDSIYTNSFFSTFTIYLLKLRMLGLIANRGVVVAPCGEFASGALTMKSSKKRLFMNYANILRLYRNVIWKASSEIEATEIKKLGPKGAEIFVAPDLPPTKIFESYDQTEKPVKETGSVKIAFLSRFVRVKNFNWVLPRLMDLEGKLQIDVIGPIEDEEYWDEAQAAITKLPRGISVRNLGPVSHERVSRTLLDYHFYLSPTLGENFGHVLLEAMASGCPLIISDRTPWKNLQKRGLGWDMPLESPGEWVSVFKKVIEMGESEYREMSVSTRRFAVDWLTAPGLAADTDKILSESLAKGSSGF